MAGRNFAKTPIAERAPFSRKEIRPRLLVKIARNGYDRNARDTRPQN